MPPGADKKQRKIKRYRRNTRSSEPVLWAMTPDQMRNEADETEQLASIVSYGRDRSWLLAKATELRRQAEKLESRSWRSEDERTPRRPDGPGASKI